MRKMKQLVLLTLVLLVFAMPLVTEVCAMGVQPMIYREYLGRETKDSWVPVFVLYDPPGDGSFSKFSQERSHTSALKYGGVWVGFDATGMTTQNWVSYVSWETSHTERMHYVVTYKFTQTWDVWEYTYPTRVLYKAYLVSSVPVQGDYGLVRFDELGVYGLWANDLTGTQGTYHCERLVGKGGTITEKFEYYLSIYGDFGVGFEVTIKGVDFSIGVQMQYASSVKTEVEYAYHSDSSSLDFHIESNYNVNWTSSQPHYVGGISIWFDQ